MKWLVGRMTETSSKCVSSRPNTRCSKPVKFCFRHRKVQRYTARYHLKAYLPQALLEKSDSPGTKIETATVCLPACTFKFKVYYAMHNV